MPLSWVGLVRNFFNSGLHLCKWLQNIYIYIIYVPVITTQHKYGLKKIRNDIANNIFLLLLKSLLIVFMVIQYYIKFQFLVTYDQMKNLNVIEFGPYLLTNFVLVFAKYFYLFDQINFTNLSVW